MLWSTLQGLWESPSRFVFRFPQNLCTWRVHTNMSHTYFVPARNIPSSTIATILLQPVIPCIHAGSTFRSLPVFKVPVCPVFSCRNVPIHIMYIILLGCREWICNYINIIMSNLNLYLCIVLHFITELLQGWFNLYRLGCQGCPGLLIIKSGKPHPSHRNYFTTKRNGMYLLIVYL